MAPQYVQDLKMPAELLLRLAELHRAPDWDSEEEYALFQRIESCGYAEIARELLRLDPERDHAIITAFIASWVIHHDHYCSYAPYRIEDPAARSAFVQVLCRQMNAGTGEYEWVLERRLTANVLHCLRCEEAVPGLLRSFEKFAGVECILALRGIGDPGTIRSAVAGLADSLSVRTVFHAHLALAALGDTAAQEALIGLAARVEGMPERVATARAHAARGERDWWELLFNDLVPRRFYRYC